MLRPFLTVTAPDWFEAQPDGLLIRVKLTPKAAADRVQGVAMEADRRVALKVAVTAPPEDGKANAALIAFLAKTWRVPKTSIELVAGATDRRKRLKIAGSPEKLTAALAEWAARLKS